MIGMVPTSSASQALGREGRGVGPVQSSPIRRFHVRTGGGVFVCVLERGIYVGGARGGWGCCCYRGFSIWEEIERMGWWSTLGEGSSPPPCTHAMKGTDATWARYSFLRGQWVQNIRGLG